MLLKVLYHRVIFIDSFPGTLLSPHLCTVVLSVQVKIARLSVLTSFFFLRIPQSLDCASPSVSHPTSKRSRSLSCLLLSDTFSFDAPVLQFFKYTTSIVLPSRVTVGSRP